MLVSASQSHFRDYVILWYSLTCWEGGGVILDRGNSITHLGVVMDSRMSFYRHIDVTSMLCRLCAQSLSTQVVFGGLFMTCTSIGIGLIRVARTWMDGHSDMYDLFPYVDRCALICLETVTRRRSDACVMFVFDVLSGRLGSPNLLSLVNVVGLRYRIRGGDFLQIDFHHTNYGVHELLNDAVLHFNQVADGLFDFHLSRNQFFNRLRSVL
jgi:hypothetical protein